MGNLAHQIMPAIINFNTSCSSVLVYYTCIRIETHSYLLSENYTIVSYHQIELITIHILETNLTIAPVISSRQVCSPFELITVGIHVIRWSVSMLWCPVIILSQSVILSQSLSLYCTVLYCLFICFNQ